MVNDANFAIGKRTIDRIKSASTVHGLDTRKSSERWLCEELSRGFSAVLTVPHMIKGGLIHAQVTRETGDLDIVFARKVSEHEVLQSLRMMAPQLASKGIEITKVGKMQELLISGDGGMRFPIEAAVGGTRINTHADITGGMRHLPARKTDQAGQPLQLQKTFGSVFFKDQQPLEAFYQNFEGQAADKLAALVLRPDTTRWKDFADVSRLQKMGLNPSKIGVELAHKLSYMYESARDVLAALPEVPQTMTFDYVREKAKHWQNWQQRNGKIAPTVDFDDVACDARIMYSNVRQVLINSYAPNHRPRRSISVADQAKAVRELRSKTAERGNNVVNIGDYRDPITLAYRPKV